MNQLRRPNRRSRARVMVCPLCRDALGTTATVTTCAGCKASYHPDCLDELGASCATLGCGRELNVERAPPLPSFRLLAHRRPQEIGPAAEPEAPASLQPAPWRLSVGIVARGLAPLLFVLGAALILLAYAIANRQLISFGLYPSRDLAWIVYAGLYCLPASLLAGVFAGIDSSSRR